MVDENTIFIGKKPLMSYVLAALRQIKGDEGTVVIKARGKAISRAVDVAEILRHQFVQTAVVDDIDISTERLTSNEGRESNVSSIEIFMHVPEEEREERVEEEAVEEETVEEETVEEETVEEEAVEEEAVEEEAVEETGEEKIEGADFLNEFKDRS